MGISPAEERPELAFAPLRDDWGRGALPVDLLLPSFLGEMPSTPRRARLGSLQAKAGLLSAPTMVRPGQPVALLGLSFLECKVEFVMVTVVTAPCP